jgi:methylthioribose-1-phosphate isomerase
VIDQRWLPHEFRVVELASLDTAAEAIRDMWVRGAPLIGATAAHGVALAMAADASDAALARACDTLAATRPTAVNLRWALDAMRAALAPVSAARRTWRSTPRSATTACCSSATSPRGTPAAPSGS